MNLLLFRREERTDDGVLRLADRRHRHLREVLKSSVGDSLRVGEINGRIGTGRLIATDPSHSELQITLDAEAPPALPLSVVLALPRPKMLRRILRGLAEVGVKDIHLINSYRVEKSYWQSPLLSRDNCEEALLAGLEQARDTKLPSVTLHKRFRPFAEDLLPGLCAGKEALLADQRTDEAYPQRPAEPALLIIGPEGGFTDFECSLIEAAGARRVTLGDRVLRVETALHCALGRHLG